MRAHEISFCVLALLLCGCTGSKQSTEGRAAADAELALLEALPYADWSETVDPGGSGVTYYVPEASWPGVNLFTNGKTEAYMMDMEGRLLHTWKLLQDGGSCSYFELLDDGAIVALCKKRYLIRVDRDSKVVWKTAIPVHHDFHILDDGRIALLIKDRVRTYNGRRVQFGGLAFLSADGTETQRWLAFEHLSELRRFHPTSRLETPTAGNGGESREKVFDYYHWNTLEILPDTPLGRSDDRFQEGNILLCPRNVNTILILDRDSLRPVWSWGGDELSLPHMPTMLPNGNIQVFDNGVERRASRILEIEPVRGEIVWEYPREGDPRFFSFSRGSSQRLPNGNTLVCVSDRGRAFEIAPDGRAVWVFENPHRKRGKRRAIYRMLRMSREEAARRMRRPTGRPGH